MAEKAVSYPHPVVGHEGDAEGVLECDAPSVTFHAGTCSLVFPRIRMTNAALNDLVVEGRAGHVVRLECGATMLREAWMLDDRSPARIDLPADRLLGRVDVCVLVVARQQLDGYRPSGLSDDYGEAFFTIEAGDVLALGPEFIFSAEKEFDPLRGDIPSIMRVKGGDFEGPFRVNFDTSLIEIQLGKSDWARYLKLKQVGSEVLHSSLVLPVLTEAIAIIRADEEKEQADEGRQELVWYRRLQMILEMRGPEPGAASIEWAQLLLENPFQRTADAVLRHHEKGDDV